MKEYKWLPKIYKWQQWRELISTEQTGTSFKYEIGEYVPSEGGVIYHRFLTGTTQNYLVVDTQDLAQAIVWSDQPSTASGAISLWDGQSNTNLITTQPGALSGAGFLCAASTNNGKTDWYLPAIQELNKLWNNLLEVSQGIETAGGNQFNTEPGEDRYWSSTEYSLYPDNNAFNYAFISGNSRFLNKNETMNVRAVRKFSI